MATPVINRRRCVLQHTPIYYSAPTYTNQIKTLERRVSNLGITELNEKHLTYALQHTQGDVEKAFEFLLLIEDSIEGIIKGYSPSTKLLGAENREGVTCYLDALLFAMFARLDCFEGILYKSFNDEARGKLSVLLRLWGNMLRSGKLITTDIVCDPSVFCTLFRGTKAD